MVTSALLSLMSIGSAVLITLVCDLQSDIGTHSGLGFNQFSTMRYKSKRLSNLIESVMPLERSSDTDTFARVHGDALIVAYILSRESPERMYTVRLLLSTLCVCIRDSFPSAC